jgi:hypothetical protein
MRHKCRTEGGVNTGEFLDVHSDDLEADAPADAEPSEVIKDGIERARARCLELGFPLPAPTPIQEPRNALSAYRELERYLKADPGGITLKQAATLVHVSIGRLRNLRSQDRRAGGEVPEPITKAAGQAGDLFDYTDLRPWLRRHYPHHNSRLPESYEEAKRLFSQPTPRKDG